MVNKQAHEVAIGLEADKVITQKVGLTRKDEGMITTEKIIFFSKEREDRGTPHKYKSCAPEVRNLALEVRIPSGTL